MKRDHSHRNPTSGQAPVTVVTIRLAEQAIVPTKIAGNIVRQ